MERHKAKVLKKLLKRLSDMDTSVQEMRVLLTQKMSGLNVSVLLAYHGRYWAENTFCFAKKKTIREREKERK